MTAVSTHAPFSPSKLPRILRCPGSYQLCQQVPRKLDSPYAAEGTQMHEYAYEAMRRFTSDPAIGTALYYQYIEDVPADLQEAVNEACQYVMGVIPESGYEIRLEQQVQLTNLENDVYGTLDIGLYDWANNIIHIADYKFGQGVQVFAKENEQLIAYALGFINFLQKQGYNIALPTIRLHIIQPRYGDGHYDTWDLDMNLLDSFYHHLVDIIHQAKNPNPPFEAGDKQCRWCEAAGVCDTFLKRTHQLASELWEGYVEETKAKIEFLKPDMARIAKLLSYKKSVKLAMDLIESIAFEQLVNNQEVPGYKLVRGRSNRAWAPNASIGRITDAIPALEDQLDKLVEMKMISPARMEKLLPKKDRDQLKEFIIKPEGKLSIVDEAHPGEAVVVKDPMAIFAEFMENPNGSSE